MRVNMMEEAVPMEGSAKGEGRYGEGAGGAGGGYEYPAPAVPYACEGASAWGGGKADAGSVPYEEPCACAC